MKMFDKKNANVGFRDKTHEYIGLTDNEKYTSVTQLIHHYTPKFDGEFWASYKACEELLGEEFLKIKGVLLDTKKWDPKFLKETGLKLTEFEEVKNRILQSYENKKNESCERGTAIHSLFENQYYQKEEHDLKKFGLGGKFTCKKDHYELDLEKGIYPEYLVSLSSRDGILKVAGQIDLLIKEGNDLYIYDYKSNREIKKSSFFDKKTKKKQMMLGPLSNIEDCNYWHYCLQLSLYAYLLQQINSNFNIKLLKLIHIDHDDRVTEYECPYLKNDVIRMLNHYKKSIKIKAELDLDKPIVF